jgi:predicted transposase YdaD
VWQAYRRWLYAQVIDALEKERTFDEGKAEGITEGEARGKAEGIAEGKAELYTQSLPLYFKLLQANPAVRGEIFAMGAAAGVEEAALQRA